MPNITIDLSNLPNATNDTYTPLYKNRDRYLVLMGGGGSGKSVFAAQKIIYRTLTEKKHRILVVRKVAKTLRESVFALLRGIINDWGMSQLFKVNKTDMTIKCLNGNEILFAGLDDVEKLKSIYNITSIWIEEASELEPGDFRQLDIRLRGKTENYKQIIFSFNPVSITHWLKTEFFDRPKPDTTTLHTTYKDNKFLDEEQARVLEGFKDSDPYFYTVYCLGEWGVVGNSVFRNDLLMLRRNQLIKNPIGTRGSLLYIKDKDGRQVLKFIEDKTGPLIIYEYPKPNYPYVIGADVAEGVSGGDYSVAQVKNNTNDIQAAKWRSHIEPDLFAFELEKLARYYNNALIGPERNNHGLTTVTELKKTYSLIYRKEVIDKITDEKREILGFDTKERSRAVLVDRLRERVREQIETINDIETIDEMLTFVFKESGKAEHMDGCHDDCVLSLGICDMIDDQQSKRVREPKKTPNRSNVDSTTGY